MKFYQSIIIILPIFISVSLSKAQKPVLVENSQIITGAENTSLYLPLLKGKKIAVVANQSSLIKTTHLVDSLVSLGIEIKCIFSPEHGFRGKEAEGKSIDNEMDKKTGIPINSLYGAYKKPGNEELENVEVVLFDLQDVGTRFYTYISTLTYVMQACSENKIPVILLDRPNPNGFYVDGPVLNEKYKSFVGLHPVPVVYGMTIGEYALMVNGQNWLESGLNCDLTVIPLTGYTHNMIVKLPVSPSPNLPNWQSIYLYPSLCFFEGTVMSVGRGTNFPFQVFGAPTYLVGSFSFMPHSIPGISPNPKYKNEKCYGRNLSGFAENEVGNNEGKLFLFWLIESYKVMKPGGDFFNDYFDKLAGSNLLRNQIEQGKTEEEIRESWQKDIELFKQIRAKYLLYH